VPGKEYASDGYLIFPETFETILRQRRVPCGVLDISVSEVGLQSASIVAVICELVTTGMAEHVRVGFDFQLSAIAARSTMREKPGAESGAPRSETNTNADFALSR
jgi:hypothetical protein